MVTTNNERNNGEVAEAEVKAETNNGNLNSSNNNIVSNSKKDYVETKILNKPDNENKNKMIENNVGFDGIFLGETRKWQQ